MGKNHVQALGCPDGPPYVPEVLVLILISGLHKNWETVARVETRFSSSIFWLLNMEDLA
jgi:hypothetical protein